MSNGYIIGVDAKKLWMGDVPSGWTDKDLTAALKFTNPTPSSVVVLKGSPRSQFAGVSNSYAFLTFGSHSTAEKFMTKYNGKLVPHVTPLLFFRLAWNRRGASAYKNDMGVEEDTKNKMCRSLWSTAFPPTITLSWIKEFVWAQVGDKVFVTRPDWMPSVTVLTFSTRRFAGMFHKKCNGLAVPTSTVTSTGSLLCVFDLHVMSECPEPVFLHTSSSSSSSSVFPVSKPVEAGAAGADVFDLSAFPSLASSASSSAAALKPRSRSRSLSLSESCPLPLPKRPAFSPVIARPTPTTSSYNSSSSTFQPLLLGLSVGGVWDLFRKV